MEFQKPITSAWTVNSFVVKLNQFSKAHDVGCENSQGLVSVEQHGEIHPGTNAWHNQYFWSLEMKNRSVLALQEEKQDDRNVA